MSKRALIFYGGWEGHFPEAIAQRYEQALKASDYSVTLSDSMDCLNDVEALKNYSVIVPCWTMGSLSGGQESALCDAVASGVGIAGAHGGMGDGFRGAVNYNFMVGGQFVGHPYVGPYTVVNAQPDHPLTAGLPDRFRYDSEQYYLHVDPNINVLLETDYDCGQGSVVMPVAWTKSWGKGRVFYCALGHAPEEYDAHPDVWDFIVSGVRWAAR